MITGHALPADRWLSGLDLHPHPRHVAWMPLLALISTSVCGNVALVYAIDHLGVVGSIADFMGTAVTRIEYPPRQPGRADCGMPVSHRRSCPA